MKKFFSVILAMLIVVSLFAVPAFASESYKKKGFSMAIPEGFVEDKQWAREKGLDGYWYNEELGIEMLLCVGLTYSFWIDDTYEGVDVSKRVPYQKMYENVRVSEKSDEMTVNGKRVLACKDLLYVKGEKGTASEDGAYFASMEYQYEITEKQYSLVFFMDNYEQDREYIEKEIISKCDYGELSAIYFTYFEPTVLKILFAAFVICVVVALSKIAVKLKEKKTNKNIKGE